MDNGRIQELKGLAFSDADRDVALRPAAILELVAEVEACHLLLASQGQHLEVVSGTLEALTTVESGE
jgi:hypothetical protein